MQSHLYRLHSISSFNIHCFISDLQSFYTILKQINTVQKEVRQCLVAIFFPDMVPQYELELLEQLISITLHPKKLLNETLVKKNKDEWLRIAAQETERIKKALKTGLFFFKKVRTRSLYIHQHRVGIVNQQDLLYHYLSGLELKNPFTKTKYAVRIDLFNQLTILLDDLLHFIEQYCHQAFPPECLLTIKQSNQFKEQLKDRLEKVQGNLLTYSNNNELPELVSSVLYEFFNNENKGQISYTEKEYTNYLLAKLESIQQSLSFSYYAVLTEMLIQLNFNSPVFNNYLLGSILKEINETESENEKLERLCFHLKEIKQIIVIPGWALYPALITVQKYITDYLQYEKRYFKKLKSLSLFAAPVYISKVEEQESIHLQMSVEELGLFTNIQKQAGLLKNPNMRSLAKLLAASHRSLRRDKISWQNLYNCFSKVEMNTINSLDDKLITMVNTLRKIKSDLKKNN